MTDPSQTPRASAGTGPGQPSQPGSTGPGGAPVGAPLSSWLRRVGAVLIDFVLLGALSCGIGTSAGWLEIDSGDVGSDRVSADAVQVNASFGLVGPVIQFLYFWLLHAYWNGQTIGKKALGIRVVDANTAAAAGVGPLALREAFFLVVPVIPCIGWIVGILNVLWPLWDPRKQAIHDKLAKTIVVRTR